MRCSVQNGFELVEKAAAATLKAIQNLSVSNDPGRPMEMSSWEDVILSSCIMLRRASPEVMPEVTVKARLPGAPGEALLTIWRAQHIADEYDIAVLAAVEPPMLTIRLISRVDREP